MNVDPLLLFSGEQNAQWQSANSASFTRSQFFTVMVNLSTNKIITFLLKDVPQVIPTEDDEELSAALDFADSF